MFSNISQYAVKYNYDYPIHSISNVVIGLRTLRDFQMLSTGEHGYTNAIQLSVFFLNIEHDPKAVDLQCHTCSKIESHNLQHKYVQSLTCPQIIPHYPMPLRSVPRLFDPFSSIRRVPRPLWRSPRVIAPSCARRLATADTKRASPAKFVTSHFLYHSIFMCFTFFHPISLSNSRSSHGFKSLTLAMTSSHSNKLWRCCNIRIVVSSCRSHHWSVVEIRCRWILVREADWSDGPWTTGCNSEILCKHLSKRVKTNLMPKINTIWYMWARANRCIRMED